MRSTSDARAFAALEAAVDERLAEDIDALSDAERLDRVKAWARIQNKLAAALTREVRAAQCHQSSEHDGLKSMGSWLRTHTRLSGAAINGMSRQGRALAHLPAV